MPDEPILRKKTRATIRNGKLAATLLVVLFLVAHCATVQETPQQAYVWEMGRICDGKDPRVRLSQVEPNGRYWIQTPGWGAGDTGSVNYFACMKEQFGRTPYAQWVSQRSPSPQTTTGAPESVGSVAPSARGGAAQPPPVRAAAAPVSTNVSILKPAWAIGDEWSYRWESPEGKGTFVWVVDRFERVDGIDLVVIKSGTRETFYRREDGALQQSTVGGLVESQYDPPLLMVPWPLEVGKKWTTAYARESPIARQTEENVLECRVDGEESVTVTAGAFRTFHVICNNQRSGSSTFELWYAPDVGNMIKERTKFTYGLRERELLGFKRAERRQ